MSCARRGSAQSVPHQADDLFSLPDSRSSPGETIKLIGSSNRLIGCGDWGGMKHSTQWEKGAVRSESCGEVALWLRSKFG